MRFHNSRRLARITLPRHPNDCRSNGVDSPNSRKIVLKPSSKNGQVDWSVAGGEVGGMVQIAARRTKSRVAPLSKAFAAAVHLIDGNGRLRFPCLIETRVDRSEVLFSFTGLPVTPDRSILVSVDRDGRHAKIEGI